MRYIIHAFLVLCAQHVAGWSDVGHRTIGYLAQMGLEPAAEKLFDDLLANDRGYDYSDAAIWADTVKTKMPWTKPWHYLSKSLQLAGLATTTES
jgi:hypothetical protein